MKKLLFLLLAVPILALAQAKQPRGVTYGAEIIKVDDGDTVIIAAHFLPAPLKPQLAIRIYGVDTPEKGGKAKCSTENKLGRAATEFTKNAINSSTQRQVTLYDWDKYGGRVLGDIILDGRSLRAMLVQNGYAREYYGGTKQSWCQ